MHPNALPFPEFLLPGFDFGADRAAVLAAAAGRLAPADRGQHQPPDGKADDHKGDDGLNLSRHRSLPANNANGRELQSDARFEWIRMIGGRCIDSISQGPAGLKDHEADEPHGAGHVGGLGQRQDGVSMTGSWRCPPTKRVMPAAGDRR